MGFEELIHVTALWIALFYAAATTTAIARVETIVNWEIWPWIALLSITMGITMIAGISLEPKKGYGTHYGRTDYTTKKWIRLLTCVLILLLVSIPFGAIEKSPTPLADFLSLTLITYIWLLYVAILVLSVFYQRESEEVIEE